MPNATLPHVLPLRDQARVVNRLLKTRFDTILPAVMRETGFDMWILVCHEDNHDPVFDTLIPWECWAPILQMVVFFDRGDTIERLNISLTNMQGLMTDVWNLASDEDQWACLSRLVAERNPKRIGINTSDTIWAADGLTASLRDRLVAALGPDVSSRLEPAETLCIRWLETRTPAELDLYVQACALGRAIIARCFSREVVTPGVTTIEDLRWAYWQTVADLGLEVSFPPFFRRIRSIEADQHWGPNDAAIRPGDMVHCDVGLKYLRFLTDHQEMAYVLRAGETEAPQGLRDGIAEANRLQDIFTESWTYGESGNAILEKALTRARTEGISKPRIYSHSLSFFLHEPGPLMGLPWAQDAIPGRGDVVMKYDTVYTVELCVARPVPEWDGQEVTFSLEQDAAFREDGVVYLAGRQTRLYLI